MSALIGALRVTLSADTANFEAGMKRAQSQANSATGAISKTLGSLKGVVTGFLATLTAGYFVNLIKQGLDYTSTLQSMSGTLGVTTKDLQTFQFAAGQTGVSQEQLQKGLLKLTVTMGQVAAGAVAPTKALKAIGITADEIKGKDTGEVFRLIADALSKVTDRSQRAAIEVALFGRAGASLDGLLAGGSKALDGLSAAAEKLGIVLSDEQIQKAHETAIKLEALKEVLSANIAGVVADNADSILTLANALASLVRSIGQAVQGWKVIKAELSGGLPGLAVGFASGGVGGAIAGYSQGSDEAAAAFRKQQMYASEWARIMSGTSAFGSKTPPPGQDIGRFLAPGGRQKKAKEDHTAEDQLKAQYQFAQQLDRAQQDTLHAQQDLAKDYIERTSIGIEILNKEKDAFYAELAYNVALNKLTKGKEGYTQAQAEQLKAQFDITDSLERQKLLQDESEQRQKDIEDLIQHDFDRRAEVLKSQESIATTAAERRRIELELLDLAYEQKRQALQNIIDTSKDYKEREDARRDLQNLNHTYGNERQGVLMQTAGPLEQWAQTVPKTAAQINEALQSIEVKGIDGLSEAIAGVITGTESLKQAFGNMAKSILADLIQMSIKMLIFRALSSVLPGVFGGSTSSLAGIGSSLNFGTNFSTVPVKGFATGGSFAIGGMAGVDKNLLSLNGVPIARVSRGEQLNIGAANDGGGIVVNQTIAPNFAGNAATQDDLVKMGIIAKNAALDAFNQRQRRSA